jgi:hypothetical protein
MSSARDLLLQRLRRQRLTGDRFPTPQAVVAWMGAVQAQDYPGARWGVGQRTARAVDADVERAFDRGAILRTHVLRPTWHFVAPADIRWMLALTGPRVHAANATRYRQLELDARTLVKGRTLMERALDGGRHLTRAELSEALARGRIAARGERLAHLVLYAELHGAICSGPRRGAQLTYARLDDRVPPAPALSRDEALAALTLRYFASHGPATLRDFAWWSGLTVSDARRGVAANGSALTMEVVDGLECWSKPSRARVPASNGAAWLLPNYDEFLIAYRDRGFVLPSRPAPAQAGWPAYPHHVIFDGRLIGGWRRSVSGGSMTIEVKGYRRLTPAEKRAVTVAFAAYDAFAAAPAVSIRIA